jgi:uncharacterized lipoprotein YddW (UPF0748 family)
VMQSRLLATALGAAALLMPSSSPLSAQRKAAVGAPRAAGVPCPQSDSSCVPPGIAREFRGVWVATVRNLDWPSRPGLPPTVQKAELIALLDRAADAGLNAVLLQVRPAADAVYRSKLEPWSEYLTGHQGLAPVPAWDPLEFAVKEAHARGLELHAWFNPYRAKEPSAKGPLARTHIARAHPELVKSYGKKQLWMDPGEPAVQAQTLKVVLDVVKRYDIDGVHLDDYFYPYPEQRPNGSTDFPDERSWKRYRKEGGKLARDDWRRDNVNQLVETLHREIAKEKPWVKFGISPFQLWRPGYPPSVTTGLDAYATLYADSRKWFASGWVDYLAPQLYRRVDEERSYGLLMNWWADQNTLRRHLWPGLYTGGIRTGAALDWRRSEILAQIADTRAMPGVTGNIHFSMDAIMKDRDGITTALERGPYAERALVPPSPWMTDGDAPGAPAVALTENSGGPILTVIPSGEASPRWWAVQLRVDGTWQTRILDGAVRSMRVSDLTAATAELIAVTAVDRFGIASAVAAVRFQ